MNKRFSQPVIIILAVIALLMSFVAPAGADAGGCADPQRKDPTISIKSLAWENDVATATFTADGLVCPWEVELRVYEPWYFWQPHDTVFSWAELEEPVPGGQFTLSLKAPDECLVVRAWAIAATSDKPDQRKRLMTTCSQEYRDRIPTFSVKPNIFIANAEDARATQKLAAKTGTDVVVVRDGALASANESALREMMNVYPYGHMVVVVGSTEALSQELFDRVSEVMTADPAALVRRVAGSDRYETLSQLLDFVPNHRG